MDSNTPPFSPFSPLTFASLSLRLYFSLLSLSLQYQHPPSLFLSPSSFSHSPSILLLSSYSSFTLALVHFFSLFLSPLVHSPVFTVPINLYPSSIYSLLPLFFSLLLSITSIQCLSDPLLLFFAVQKQDLIILILRSI